MESPGFVKSLGTQIEEFLKSQRTFADELQKSSPLPLHVIANFFNSNHTLKSLDFLYSVIM